MTTQLLTDLTVADICDGFVYNELEGKGLSVGVVSSSFSLNISAITFMPMVSAMSLLLTRF